LSAFKSSCLTPLPFCCFNLGLSYEEGKGVKQDDFKALKFYQKACDLNFSGKCFEIILFNALAFFIHKSKLRATTAKIQTTRLLVNECKTGAECVDLGFKYITGKDVKQDDFKALKFLQKACGLNFSGGCYNLGNLGVFV
jgi:TPR repeat protein